MAKYIAFVAQPQHGRVTTWGVCAKRDGTSLGNIMWSPGWRRLVLWPGYPTEWSADCLRDVAEFMDRRENEHPEAPR